MMCVTKPILLQFEYKKSFIIIKILLLNGYKKSINIIITGVNVF